MKRLLFLLAGSLATAGAASAQAQFPAAQSLSPGYYGPGMPTGPGAMSGASSMPAYYGPSSMPMPGMSGAPASMPAYYGSSSVPTPGMSGAPASMPAYYGPGPGAAPAPGMMGGPMPMPMSPEVDSHNRAYGWHPGLRNLFTRGKTCENCNSGKKRTGYFNKSKVISSPENAQGGTLVFPHHPFVRSPRDFFEQ